MRNIKQVTEEIEPCNGKDENSQKNQSVFSILRKKGKKNQQDHGSNYQRNMRNPIVEDSVQDIPEGASGFRMKWVH